jgi:CHASE3 domain sensor protein
MNLTYIQKIGLTFSLAIILFLLRYLVSRWVSIRETIETRQRRQILIAVRDALSFLFFRSVFGYGIPN